MKKKKGLFQDIVGYQETKKTLERIIDVLNNQEKYKKLGSTIPHGLFLYGPPGLGKTTLSKEVLKHVENRNTYIIRKIKSDGDFMNYMGKIFTKAKENQPSIILLDDIDKFAEEDNVYNHEEFIAVQSFIDDIKNDDVFVIATANDRHMLPKTLLRAGRFDIQIEINYPSEEDSYDIIKFYLKNKKISNDVNLKNISYILGSSSCADLEKVCNQAGIYAGFKNKGVIGMEELIRASLESTYETNIEEEKEDYPYSLEVAYHEAGHALVGSILEPGSVSFVSIAKWESDSKGITKYHNNKYYFDDIQFMDNRLTTLMAGKAAIEIIYHKCDAGVRSDLERAFRLAGRFTDAFCMLDFKSWIRPGCENEQSEIVKQSKDQNISKIVEEHYLKAKELLIANRSKLDDLAQELVSKKILFQEDIEKIIS